MSTDRRWSYQTVEVKPTLMGGLKTELIQEELTRHGNLGWELVNVIAAAPMTPVVLIFKRPQ
ncbi:protein of unknown function [Pseudoxanthomonas sp. GM95]|uniref:DUF4177 domain-containing protein n=1 Tax=Pseudoxanthomonas sp. GM95 TaxID=1881043 RepID=UPI0008B9AAA4|nr:DUF4177 domain-containing protein [Pseudoxanthomonas sp. GM95]SEK79299.1 protein of unknown function [Pseudoxanthomonas sp. GM95]